MTELLMRKLSSFGKMFILSCLSRKPGPRVWISEGTKLKGGKKREREREVRKRQEFDSSFEMEKVIIIRGELKSGREDGRW